MAVTITFLLAAGCNNHEKLNAYTGQPTLPLSVAIAPHGKTIAVGETAANTVIIIDTGNQRVRFQIQLEGRPEGLAWSNDGNRLFASECGAGSIVEIDPAHGKILRRITTGRYPSGIQIDEQRGNLMVIDRGLNRLDVIEMKSGKPLAQIPTSTQPGFMAINQKRSIAAVSNLIPSTATNAQFGHAAEVTLVDLDSQTVRSSVRLPAGSTNARGIVIGPKDDMAYVVHTIRNENALTNPSESSRLVINAISIIDLSSASLANTVMLDTPSEGAALPWCVQISPDGDTLFITLSGTHELAALDLAGLASTHGSQPMGDHPGIQDLEQTGLLKRIKLPSKGPRGMSLSSNGEILAVAGNFSRNVTLLNTQNFETTEIPLGADHKLSQIELGELAFHDAEKNQIRGLSCATCHTDGRTDGLIWDLPHDGPGNPKNSRSLLLAHATPPMMSLGGRDKNESSLDFALHHMQPVIEHETNEVEAIRTLIASLKPEISPQRNADGSLSDAATRGRAIFSNPDVGCAMCHSQPLYTNLAAFNVGTASTLDGGDTSFDTPTLIELWRTPPYLHDGRAATLRDVFIDHNPNNRHGRTSQLSSNDIDDLVAYLLSL